MEHLIRDLLDVVRMESGHLQVEVRGWAPMALVGAAADAAAPQAELQRVKLRTALEPSLPLVAADRDRVLQVFSNLIGNALKFTPAEGTIELKGWAAAGRVWFAVSDTGTGIPAEQLQHIFERFWQLNRRDRRGLGLGLGICKWIVESHGGEIQVDSVPGHGTTFRFWLPIAQ
jgi:signal transduction histidine kinase